MFSSLCEDFFGASVHFQENRKSRQKMLKDHEHALFIFYDYRQIVLYLEEIDSFVDDDVHDACAVNEARSDTAVLIRSDDLDADIFDEQD